MGVEVLDKHYMLWYCIFAAQYKVVVSHELSLLRS